LGAAALNTTIPKALSLIAEEQRPHVTHQSGEKHLVSLQKTYQDLGVTANVVPFIEDMTDAYAKADLVICRAGAMTVAELSAVGVASYLVPFPHAVDDHQTFNAKFLADAGGAILMPQANFDSEKLAHYLLKLDRKELQKMAEQSLTLAKPMATQDVALVCKQFCKDGTPA
jgi:UDP-N-acetylglucosamine--N-acetylmuramyl-(pentapeptide) pyrophosphoryl-undecaprenol N-acetylglucosamine transferase